MVFCPQQITMPILLTLLGGIGGGGTHQKRVAMEDTKKKHSNSNKYFYNTDVFDMMSVNQPSNIFHTS